MTKLLRPLLTAALVSVLICACSKKEEPVLENAAAAPETLSGEEGALPAVLIEVDGKKLTREAALQEIDTRLASMQQSENVSAEQMQAMRRQGLDTVVEQFTVKTLLLAQADKQGITVAEEDEQQALAKIAERLPEGMTPEQIMQNSPIGEERMRAEVRAGIRINKLLGSLAAGVEEVTDEEIHRFSEENKEQLQLPENVQARHILIAFTPEDDDAAKAEKKKKAEELRQQLVNGAAFEEVAAQHSDCPSKERGGDLGTFGMGQMVKPFEDAAFSQEVDELGPIVETRFGYHIIQVREHSEPGPFPRERVAQIVLNRKQQQAMAAFVEQLKGNAKITDFRK